MRFPEFTEEWETKKLGEIIVEGKLGGNYENSESYKGFPVIKMGNLGRGEIVLDKIQYLSQNEKYNEDDVLKAGDLLFNTRNTLELVGKVAIWRNELPFALYNSNLMRIKVNNLLEPSNRFLNLYFNTNGAINQLRSFATGTTSVAAIYSRDLAGFTVIFPSVQEQIKIASFLSLIDERITTQNKIIKELKVLKTTITKRIFSGQLRFKNAGGTNYEDWKTKKLGDVTTLINKRNKNNEKLPVYSINNKLGFVPQSEQFEGVDSEDRGYDITLYKIIDKNTFAYNPARINVGSIGYSGYLENIIISSLYVCFKTDESVNDNFLFQYLKTDFFNKEVLRNVEGGVRDYLFYENFARIKFDLPCVEEQRKIADYLSSIDLKIDIETQFLNKLEEQKKFLLQQMFV
ncbi:restriction endonuclease subunit S [Sphingobacterium siyangense]|uniref:restriction endonuclease subunit S n=1 Tax=Sphingobacterium siyangense TaxID=459529 RepID=UPI003C73DE96